MYEKFKATIWGRLENDESHMDMFVEPWQLVPLITMALDNCKVVKIDGGIRAQEPEEDDDEL